MALSLFAAPIPTNATHPTFGDGYFSPHVVLERGGTLITFTGNKGRAVVYRCKKGYTKCSYLEKELSMAGWFDDGMPGDILKVKMNGKSYRIPPLKAGEVYRLNDNIKMAVVTFSGNTAKRSVSLKCMNGNGAWKNAGTKRTESSYFIASPGSCKIISAKGAINFTLKENDNKTIDL